jgi:hypothetical protein
VAQQLLDLAQVCVSAKELRGEDVAEGMSTSGSYDLPLRLRTPKKPEVLPDVLMTSLGQPSGPLPERP